MKLLSLMVIGLLLVSMVPLVLADEAKSTGGETTFVGPPTTERMPPTVMGDDTGMHAGDENETGTAPAGTGTSAKPPRRRMPPVAIRAHDVRREVKERVQETRGKARSVMEERRGKAHERLEQRREAIRERFAAARERYKNAKEHYLDARKKFISTKRKIGNAREKWGECRGDTSERCQNVRKTIKANAKPFLLHSADMVLNALERLETRVAENENMDPDVQAALVNKLEADIKEVSSAKATIENLDENSTPDEIRAAAKTIRNAWHDVRKTIKRATGHLINARVGQVIVQVERLQERIQKVRDKLAAQGYDVTALDEAPSMQSSRPQKASGSRPRSSGRRLTARATSTRSRKRRTSTS